MAVPTCPPKSGRPSRFSIDTVGNEETNLASFYDEFSCADNEGACDQSRDQVKGPVIGVGMSRRAGVGGGYRHQGYLGC